MPKPLTERINAVREARQVTRATAEREALREKVMASPNGLTACIEDAFRVNPTTTREP